MQKAGETKTEGGTVFDSVFRTFVEKHPREMVPLFREVFGGDIPDDASCVQFRNEFHKKDGKAVVADSVFWIRAGDRLFHVECQSTEDGRMSVRMLEYDFLIALEHAEKRDGMWEVDFPHSCVLYIRGEGGANERVKVNFPDGQSVAYESKAVRVQAYSLDEMLEKKLYVFLPFYILREESRIGEIAEDEQERARLQADVLDRIYEKLAEDFSGPEGVGTVKDIAGLIDEVLGRVFAGYPEAKEGIKMGGKLLKLPSDIDREIGREEGRKEGREEGLKEGRAQAEIEIQKKNDQIDALLRELYEARKALKAAGVETDSAL